MIVSSLAKRVRRPSPLGAAALFVIAGLGLLLGPELLAKSVSGAQPNLADFSGDILFIAFGAAAAWYLASRIEAAFERETTARQAVERRERVLADVIDAVPTAVLLISDADDLPVAHANPAAARLLDAGAHLDAGGDAPRCGLQRVLPIDAATLDALRAALSAGTPWTGERTVVLPSGRRLPVALAATPIAGGEATREVLVVQDRTELKFAERESERLAVELEGFVQTAPVGFVTVGADGRVDAWNAAAERILGWSASEMVGSRLPADLGRVIAETLAAGASVPGSPNAVAADTHDPADAPEVEMRRATGEPVAVRLTATTAYGRGHDFFGFTAMFEDITEPRRIAAERDEAEARFRAAVDASPIPLVLLDPEGKVRLWSAAAERLYGWTADEAIASVFPPVPDEELASFFERLGRVMRGTETVAERLPCVARDGRAIPTRFSSAPVRAADGSLVGVMAACHEDLAADAAASAASPRAPMQATMAGSPVQSVHPSPGGSPG